MAQLVSSFSDFMYRKKRITDSYSVFNILKREYTLKMSYPFHYVRAAQYCSVVLWCSILHSPPGGSIPSAESSTRVKAHMIGYPACQVFFLLHSKVHSLLRLPLWSWCYIPLHFLCISIWNYTFQPKSVIYYWFFK